jgi:two-component system, LytTR family, response regulator
MNGNSLISATEGLRSLAFLAADPEIAERFAQARSSALAAKRLVVKSGNRMIVLLREKIEWVEGEREYVRLHVGRESHLVRQTMHAMEQVLTPFGFVRVHRSIIVNLDFVKEMVPLESGDYEITMRDSKKLRMSRKYRACLQSLLRDSFRSEAGEKPAR